MNDKVQFYDLKAKAHVDVPIAEVTKQVSRRRLKSGAEQDRYQLKATHEGRALFKFVSRATYDALP